MIESPVSYTLEGTTAVIRMDDGKANALNYPMIDALIAALDRAEREAGSVVVTGRPERFCAGFDMKLMGASPQSAVDLLTRGADLLLRMYGSPLPVVMACTGHALAGGALLVLTGDVRLGIEGAFKIGLNEVAIGMPVPVLAMEFARDRLTSTALPRATLGAHVHTPAEAVTAGFLDAALPAGELLDRARAEAARLGAYSRVAYGATKQRLRGKTIEYIRTSLASDLASLLPAG
jgi:enoyl-CoA hydratase